MARRLAAAAGAGLLLVGIVGWGPSGWAASGPISTVAGTGTPAYSGDGGPAISAALSFPLGVAVDGSGNMFIADGSNNRIRKVSPAGTITTFAGTGAAGYSGDGGPATSAALNFPTDVAVDGAGDVFVADFMNSRVREISSAGVITTVAGTGTPGLSGDGGPATLARLTEPAGLDLDSAGNLYVADYGNNTVRRVTPSGIISRVAGTATGTSGYSGDGGPATAAALKEPGDVAVSGGNVYIADSGNARVRKVSTTGVISTVAGTGAPGFSGDGGPAVAAQLVWPAGLAVDSSSGLFVADYGNNRIRKIDASGTITTVAGNGVAGYTGDGGPATSAELNAPARVNFDAAGNFYVSDSGNSRVRKVQTLGSPATVPGAPTGATASAGDGSATVTWAAPASNGGSAITAYKVTSSGGQTATVSGSTLTASVPGLTNGTSYTFTVAATNAVGAGPASAASNAVTPVAPGVPATPPGPPTSVSATAGNGAATVTWAAPASDGGSPITAYTVTSSGGQSATLSGSTLTATFAGLTNGTSYTFSVTATNAKGTGLAATSNSVTPAAPPPPTTTPGAPTAVSASAGNAVATVSWVAPASNGGSAITGYTVTSSGGQSATVSGSTLSASVGSLANGTPYTFTVTATNAVGAGPASGPSNSVTPTAPAPPPPAPPTSPSPAPASPPPASPAPVPPPPAPAPSAPTPAGSVAAPAPVAPAPAAPAPVPPALSPPDPAASQPAKAPSVPVPVAFGAGTLIVSTPAQVPAGPVPVQPNESAAPATPVAPAALSAPAQAATPRAPLTRRRSTPARPTAMAGAGAHGPVSTQERLTRIATATAKSGAIPMGLIVVAFVFLVAQDRIDRNDPKLALAPVFGEPDLQFPSHPGGVAR